MGKRRNEWRYSNDLLDVMFTSNNRFNTPGVGQFYEIIDGCGLSKRQRQVVELVFAMSMSYSAAAKFLGVSKSVVQKYYEKAMVKLRNKYCK